MWVQNTVATFVTSVIYIPEMCLSCFRAAGSRGSHNRRDNRRGSVRF